MKLGLDEAGIGRGWDGGFYLFSGGRVLLKDGGRTIMSAG